MRGLAVFTRSGSTYLFDEGSVQWIPPADSPTGDRRFGNFVMFAYAWYTVGRKPILPSSFTAPEEGSARLSFSILDCDEEVSLTTSIVRHWTWLGEGSTEGVTGNADALAQIALEVVRHGLDSGAYKLQSGENGPWLHPKIQAIKDLRVRTGCGLREAKDAIDFVEKRATVTVTLPDWSDLALEELRNKLSV